ncbi:hypothetical protein BDV95DRAFT_673985 [Massariosphaeria phaeospora]|uniref:Uncharacterized protein n=1 Tax=Massariosphaeria phaeospora TaxID=100035 RepID=A0A7C8MFX6_9PLEO|nr:hypothetical protein BDV95DRAFT_673985 [Massariosphaeria phaeospora]
MVAHDMVMTQASSRASTVPECPIFVGQSVPYCDSLTSICYQSYTDDNGISLRIALPKVTAAPFDSIIQIVAPIKYKWIGFSWGGTMAYVPLLVGWPNGNSVVHTSRIAFGLILPNPYANATYTQMKGSGANSTHWTLTVRAQGASQWYDSEGTLVTLNPNDAGTFAHAYSTRAVSQPARNTSAFNHHDSVGYPSIDLAAAQSASFDSWVASNLIPDTPPPTTVPAPTTLSSTVRPSSSPTGAVPIGTGVPSSCASAPEPRFSSKVASGWRAVKLAGGLTNPRALVLDSVGNVLVIENGKGIVGYSRGADACVTSSKTIVSQANLAHGIALSADGKTLFASSMTKVWSWSYDAATLSVSAQKELVVGMFAGGHTTRTLAIPRKYPNLLVVSHGSNGNFDYESIDPKTGRAAVKVFDLSAVPSGGYDYTTKGYQMGYGLRNSVGLAFDASGMLWAVENGSEGLTRTVNTTTTDLNEDNPGEEVNLLGDPSKPNTKWYGYPTCHSVWQPSAFPDQKFTIGDQFTLEPNATFDDAACKQRSTPAKLVMQAHSVPLGCEFSPDSSTLYVTFHGSSARGTPTGYKVVQVPFSKLGNGGFDPEASPSSADGYTDVWSNVDDAKCSMLDCFRPVGITVDKVGRLYVTSDGAAEGELYLLGKV